MWHLRLVQVLFYGQMISDGISIVIQIIYAKITTKTNRKKQQQQTIDGLEQAHIGTIFRLVKALILPTNK